MARCFRAARPSEPDQLWFLRHPQRAQPFGWPSHRPSTTARSAVVDGPQSGATGLSGTLPQFYSYFDLYNEQAFLHDAGRLRSDTWNEWKDGIVANLTKLQFKAAWLYIYKRAKPLGEFEGVAAIWERIDFENGSPEAEDV